MGLEEVMELLLETTGHAVERASIDVLTVTIPTIWEPIPVDWFSMGVLDLRAKHLAALCIGARITVQSWLGQDTGESNKFLYSHAVGRVLDKIPSCKRATFAKRSVRIWSFCIVKGFFEGSC